MLKTPPAPFPKIDTRPVVSGPSPIYFASGYIASKDFWTYGLIRRLLNREQQIVFDQLPIGQPRPPVPTAGPTRCGSSIALAD